MYRSRESVNPNEPSPETGHGPGAGRARPSSAATTAAHRRDPRPLDPACDRPACRDFSRGALRHLATTNEMLAGTLLSLHNLRFFHAFLERVRAAIAEDRLDGLAEAELPRLSRRVGPEDLAALEGR